MSTALAQYITTHVEAGRTVTFGPMTKHAEGEEPEIVVYVSVRERDAFPTFGAHVESGDGLTPDEAVRSATP